MADVARLDGRTVVVTGARRGLGFEIARRVARDGAHVWIGDIDGDGAASAAHVLRNEGLSAASACVDVTDEQSVEQFAATVCASGAPWGLVNNAARADGVGGKLFQDITVHEWDAIMTVNARGPWLVSRAFAPAMIANGEGRVVNIASDAALYGSPRLAHYVSSKGALIALTRAMARELGACGIAVNAVAPGLSVTEATERVPPERHELYRRNRIVQRPQLPSDTAGVVGFLLGPASGYVIGQVVVVDGGFIFS